MTNIKVRGLKCYFEPKTGKVYRYHRKTGTRILAAPGSVEFFAELAAAEQKLKKGKAPAAVRGSLKAVIIEYRQAPAYQLLKQRTKLDYERVLDFLRPLSQRPIAEFDSPKIVRIRDKAFQQRKFRFANYVVALISILMEFARERGLVDHNPASQVRKLRRPSDLKQTNRPWTKDELEVVARTLPYHLAVPLAIGRWTGLREGDVLRLPLSAYDGAALRVTTSKRGVQVVCPVAAPLKQLLESRKGCNAMTLCVNSRGSPWTESGFRASFFKHLRKLEAQKSIGSGLTFHGLRHTVATELREFGFDTRTIADMLGQKSEAMAQHYSKSADLSAKLKTVVERMENKSRGD